MIKRGNKKGSHVGVMVSFAIFITFILFLYAIIQPVLNSQKDKESLSNNLEFAILNKISYDMTSASIFLEDNIGSDCINLDGAKSKLGIGNNIVAKDGAGTMLDAYLQNLASNDILIQGTTTSEDFINVYYSPSLNVAETSSLSCVLLEEGEDYTIGLVKTKKYLFEVKMRDLINEYVNYGNLKSELNLPQSVDFGFGLVLSNGTTIETVQNEPVTNIYVQETPIEYVNLEGNIVLGHIKTKIW